MREGGEEVGRGKVGKTVTNGLTPRRGAVPFVHFGLENPNISVSVRL